MSTQFNSNLIWTLLFILSCSKNTNLYPDPNTIIKGPTGMAKENSILKGFLNSKTNLLARIRSSFLVIALCKVVVIGIIDTNQTILLIEVFQEIILLGF